MSDSTPTRSAREAPDELRFGRLLVSLLDEGKDMRGGQPWKLRDMVASAMQHAWNDFVSDTGCYPECIQKEGRGRLSADFERSNFALFVAEWLTAEFREAAKALSASDARDGGEDDDRIVDADWCECGVFLPDVTDGIASHRVGCARFPAPKRYVVRSDRAEMYEDKDGNWVAWSDYERLLVSRSPSSGAEAGLPPGESPQRDEVCDALSEALLYCGDLAYHAGERTTVDLRDSGHARALARLLTRRDSDGHDGWHGEQTRKLWERIGAALVVRAPAGGR